MLKWIALAVGAALLAACNPVAQTQDARAQVDLFHERLNAGDDDAIWTNADESLRETATREELFRLLASVRKSLGDVEETSQNGMGVNTNMQGTFTTLRMETHFERGRGAETFVFRGSGDSLRLIAYNINSPDMMSDLMQTYEKSDGSEAEDSTSETDGPTRAVERVEIVPFRE